MSETFELRTDAIAVGDPTIGLVIVPLQLTPGRYRLVRGALRRPGLLARGVMIDTESMVVYAVDANLAGQFEAAFHAVARTVSYNMAEMQKLHVQIEARIGALVGFYWVGELAGTWSESTFVFNPKKVAPNRG